MTGTEVLERMREDPKLSAIPVIALTAHAMPEDRETFLAQGFDAYVAKPIVDDAVLVEAIERLLGEGRPA
jgi:CheY-like chemotaxis protein